LLARREQVRSTQTAPAVEPDPDLFRPQDTSATPFSMPTSTGSGSEQTAENTTAASGEPPAPADRTATTSRLLEAKRRAQRR
jgi:hypothetical protein